MTSPMASVCMVPVASISVLNPRVRNKRVFGELVASISAVGLKKPVTVRPSSQAGRYDLVCGQGRLEAFAELRQADIPAVIIEATDEDCYLMSLVENLARRHHPPLELLSEIGSLRKRGYSFAEMSRKTGLSPEYMQAICFLLENGEHKLLKAVERGTIPHSIAIEIARSNEADVQAALTEAYENKKLPGNQVLAIRRIIEQRRTGKGRERNRAQNGARKPVTSEALIRAYKREIERQRQQVKTADLARNRLVFVISALRTLLADKHFETLLRAEGLPTMPKSLHDRVAAEA